MYACMHVSFLAVNVRMYCMYVSMYVRMHLCFLAVGVGVWMCLIDMYVCMCVYVCMYLPWL